ncbi:hypothetical protein [Alkalibacillus salilacus]|uniref:Uncharacterized protein n=1 Tax=Alkalibacillus salilacus TaxID=284582 RepID=A0ABT9VH59_9BACI|nr:hypothetical protein [Alkalibacillus salilacus]MDQ0160302.1 hypothetical protein [Alkalibacillus salilacus]
MKVFVYPCFHPFGYELVSYYLLAGHDVVGKDVLDSDQSWHYYAMVARHARFTLVEDSSKEFEPFHEAFCINEHCDVIADRVSIIEIDEEG